MAHLQIYYMAFALFFYPACAVLHKNNPVAVVPAFESEQYCLIASVGEFVIQEEFGAFDSKRGEFFLDTGLFEGNVGDSLIPVDVVVGYEVV